VGGVIQRLAGPGRNSDALIAATALTHGLTVVTRNVDDFEPMGVALLNRRLATAR
jgi:predicted nucleic acid-binding protein